MIISTTDSVPNKKIVEVLGIARGNTVRARIVFKDIVAGLKSMIGGEISEYTKLQADSREEAIKRMIADAEKMGAEAILNVRLESATLMQGAAELIAYGTAVKLE